MSRPISISSSLDASGGDDTTADSAQIQTDAAVLQVENDPAGASMSVDFHLQARLDDEVPWADWIAPFTGVENGATRLVPVDIEGVTDLRIRIINQDSSGADVAAELETI
jgi:hypothetical protein